MNTAEQPTIDPLGRAITLHHRTWFGHIIKGHPEVERERSLVAAAIANPLVIRHSNADANVRLYFGEGPRDSVMILVAVDISLGLVKTAHFARKLSGGATEWSRRTQ